MDTKRPQLSLDELHQLKWLLGGVLTLLAVWTVFYMDIDAWALMAVTTVATLATLLRPTLPARLPSLAHTLAFPAIVTFFVCDLWLTQEVLPAMVRLDILLLLYRNLSYRQRRDDLQVIVLGLFLIVVAGVLTVSLTFAGQILLYTACALAFLLTITLADAAVAGAARAAGAKTGEPPAWAARVDWAQLFRRLRAVADWRVLGFGALLFVGVVVVSGLLFLAIPRFQLENGLFLDRLVSRKAKSGFSDTIRIGEVTEIQQDSSVALRVDVSDPAQLPATPYWRMFVLDEYHDGVFRLSPLARVQSMEGERSAVRIAGTARPRRAAARWTFYFEPGVSRYLPLLGEFFTLEFREAQNFRKSNELNVVALRDEPVTMTAYRVDGFDLSGVLRDPKFAQRWRAREQAGQSRALLQIRAASADRDRTALARIAAEALHGSVAAPEQNPALPAAEFARRVGAWLRAQHGYSLQPRIPAGEGDPLVRWAASREAGHCELFAGSFVLLARVSGYPARVVTGFKGGTWNAYSGSFTVRNSDAHAWAEIFDVATGAWLRVDPLELPAGVSEEAAAAAAAAPARTDRSWSARFDSLRVFWYRRIVSFDQRSQLATLRAMKLATENSSRRMRDALDDTLGRVKTWLSAPWDLGRWLRVIYTLVLAVGLGWWWRAQGRDVWWRLFGRGRGHRLDPVRHEAGRWLVRLGACPTSTTGLDAARRELQRLRFGARQTWPEPQRVFRQARREWRDARRLERAAR
jgi:hypothetical protein